MNRSTCNVPRKGNGPGNIISITLLLLFLLQTMPLYAQVSANFTASQTSGCPPVVINFTNTSTGATSYSWNFGNTNTSTLQNASTSYSVPGTYTVTMTASNGSASDTKTMQITIYSSPIVSFTANDTLICPGTPISFTNNTNPQSAGAATYYWDFGDGTTSTAQNPTHNYQVAGYYSVTLTATNSNGCSSSQTLNGYVHVRQAPAASFYLGNSLFCTLPAAAAFTSQTTGSNPFTYSWSFGDGGTSTFASPTHNYATTGIYTVKEIVTDNNGCTDTVVNTENITTANLVASFTGPDSVCTLNAVTFTNTTTSTFTANYWDYGDGATYTGNNPVHTYVTAGNYVVQLVIYNGSCYDTVTRNIKIRQPPAVTISTLPSMPCPAPSNIQFSVAGGNPTDTYKWNFGDGDSATGPTPSHVYTTNDFFTVTLNVQDFCPASLTNTVKIYNFLPNYSELPKQEGCAPLTVNFAFGATTLTPHLLQPIAYPYPITSYHYNYEDGTPIVTTATTSRTYTNIGTYGVQLIVTYGSGCTDTLMDSVFVGQAPVADTFSASPVHVCKRDTITLKAKATGLQPLLYVYVVNPYSSDSTIGGVNDSVEHYVSPVPGTFPMHFFASNYGCNSAMSPSITVVIDSPAAIDTTPIYHCDNKLEVSFKDLSIGASSRLFLFGDGDTSSAPTPSHVYSAPGNYLALLTVKNSTSGCTDTTTIPVQVFRLQPVAQVTDSAICLNDSIFLLPSYTSSSSAITPTGYKWFVNNTFIDTTTSAQPFIFHANDTGFSTVMLLEGDFHKCYDTGYKYMFVSQPAAGFIASPLQACLPSSVIFTDTSHDTHGAYITSRAWTFGDGTSNTVTTATTSHPYNSAGSFSIKEVVTDNNGCMDSVYRYAYIHTHKPIAGFAVANTFHCIGDTITFVNTNPIGLSGSYWDFGDGTTSYGTNPQHSYWAAGNYTVKLAITDTAGCTDTLIKNMYINISKPHAGFSDNDSTGVCAPLVVNLSNTSTNASTYNWSFGNTNTSVAVNPTTSYSTPGNYTIQLIAINTHGCKDTAYHQVSLYGYSGTFSYTPLSGCPFLPVSFTANITNIPSIVWDFGDGTVTNPSTNNTITHTYSSPGKYLPKVILGDSSGCHSSISGADTIRIDKVSAGFSETSAICLYDTVHFTDTSSGLFSPLYTWSWSFGDNGSSASHNPLHPYHTAGSYPVMLVVTDVAGCRDTARSTIVVHTLPVITHIGDTTICPGDSAKVTAYGANNYLWSSAHCPSCNPAFVTPTAPGYYTVVGTDANGCKNKDSVKIRFTYKTVSHAGPGGQVCLGQSITLSDSGAQNYYWYPNYALSSDNSALTIATPSYSLTYLAIAQTASCIPDTNMVDVVVNPLPKVTAQGATTVPAGNKVNLQAYGPNIVSFLWNHADLLNCDNCPNPEATMQQTTTFTVIAANQYGCEDSDHVTVNVLCDKSQVFIPNTFTPNGDGQNDVFYPRGIGIREVTSFRIYNRWGQLVFEKDNFQLNDEHSGWDGTFNGAKPVPDTYVYAVDAVCDEGQNMSWKGDVTLLK